MTASDTKAMVLDTIARNIRNIERAQADGRTGYVHFWPEHCLGVQINGSELRVMGVEHATIVRRTDPRSFKNGAGLAAVITERGEALARALAHTKQVYETLSMACAA